MKKLLFGLIATVMFSVSGFASISSVKKDKLIKRETIVLLKKKNLVGSCTVCITISIAGSGGSMCATASTCKEARLMLTQP